MIKLLKKLISFSSDKDHPHAVKECFYFCAHYLKKAGFKVRTYSVKKDFSLLAARKLKKHFQYILNGHLDIVPANYPQAFKPVVKGDRLYGRGTSDMKGPVAAMMALVKDKELENVDMALLLTTDEERGGFNGVKYLVDKKGYSCDCVVVPDGGDNFRLILTEKGVLHLKFEAKGKAAHGSRPWQGENAIEKLIYIFQEIKKRIPETTAKNRWLTTVNLGKIVGGDATNKVPATAQMHLDFRFPKESDKDKVLNLIKTLVKQTKRVYFTIESEGSLMSTPIANPYIKKMLRIAKDKGIGLKADKDHGASDGRFFSAKGIPVVMFKPICSFPHIDNEWINFRSLDKFYQIIKDFLLT